MNRPSSTDMKHLAAFFRGLDWWRLEPRHDLILNQALDPAKRMVLARSAAGDLAVAYLPDNPAISLEMSAFPPPLQWRWFNPATGQSQAGPGPHGPGRDADLRAACWVERRFAGASAAVNL